MATRVPSAVGQAAQESTDRLMDLFIKGKMYGLQERQVGVQERYAATGERSQALSELVNLLALAPPGTTLGQFPAAHEAVGKVWGMDPSELADMEIARPDLDDTLSRAIIGMMETDPELTSSLLNENLLARTLSARLTGEPALPSEAELRGVRAETGLRAMESWQPDPTESMNIARSVLGLDPVTPVVDLITGQTIGVFETETAAGLATDLLKLRLSLFNALEMQQIKTSDDIVGEFVGQLKDAGLVVSRAVATRIIHAAHGGEDDVASLLETYEGAPDVQKAFQIYLTGTRIAEEHLYQWLSQFPGGEDFGNSLRILSEVSERLGATETANIYNELLRAFFEGGGQARGRWERFMGAFPGGSGGLAGKVESVTGARREGEEGGAASASPEDMEAARILQGFNQVMAGEKTLGQLRAEGFTPNDIRLIQEAVALRRREQRR